MTNRTWIGGGNNNADNPKDWSPSGVPQSGDNLYVIGTINISDQNLVSDSLQLNGVTTANISDGSSISAADGSGLDTINIKGEDYLSLQVGSGTQQTQSDTIVNLIGSKAQWTGGFSVTASSPTDGAKLLVNGGMSFIDNGMSASLQEVGVFGQGAQATINTNLAGSDVVRVFDGGVLELGGSVGAGQSFLVDGNLNAGFSTVLQIDNPHTFSGSIGSLNNAEVDLIGLANVDSYTYMNDILSLYQGTAIVGTLAIQGSPFSVEKTNVGVTIYTTGDFHPNGWHHVAFARLKWA